MTILGWFTVPVSLLLLCYLAARGAWDVITDARLRLHRHATPRRRRPAPARLPSPPPGPFPPVPRPAEAAPTMVPDFPPSSERPTQALPVLHDGRQT